MSCLCGGAGCSKAAPDAVLVGRATRDANAGADAAPLPTVACCAFTSASVSGSGVCTSAGSERGEGNCERERLMRSKRSLSRCTRSRSISNFWPSSRASCLSCSSESERVLLCGGAGFSKAPEDVVLVGRATRDANAGADGSPSGVPPVFTYRTFLDFRLFPDPTERTRRFERIDNFERADPRERLTRRDLPPPLYAPTFETMNGEAYDLEQNQNSKEMRTKR